MTRFEAEILVQRLGQRHWRQYRAVIMWRAPQTYVAVVTHKASNTQFDVTDPSWAPGKTDHAHADVGAPS